MWVIVYEYFPLQRWISKVDVPGCYELTNEFADARRFPTLDAAQREILRLKLSDRWQAKRIEDVR